MVAEAALFFCHKPDTAHFFVGELAEKVNALLTGRHEESQLSAKGVGLVLRELEFMANVLHKVSGLL